MITVLLLSFVLCGKLLAQRNCADTKTGCPGWKSSCNLDYIKKMCPLSCNACKGTSGGCKDTNPGCPSWKSSCNLDYIKKMCPSTCNACGGVPVTRRPPTGGRRCGVSSISGSRIISGTTPRQGAWPWQIYIEYANKGCGGSLITPYWILTAAHCVKGNEHNLAGFIIRAGEHNRLYQEGNEQELRASRIISHSYYGRNGPKDMDYDIALIKLSQPARIGRFVSTVCLPSRGVAVGSYCYMSGWGRILPKSTMHYLLQQARMRVVRNDVCHRLNYGSERVPVTRRMICAGNGGRARTIGCKGDSGGPFVCKTGRNGAWELHGITSWGSSKCDSRKAYTVFVRVTELRSWIDQQMRNN